MTKRKVAQPDLIDLLLADYQKPEDLIGENGILKQLTKAIVERALQAELAAHLGHDKHETVANDSGNTRNGSSAKTLKSKKGQVLFLVFTLRHDRPMKKLGAASYFTL